MSDLTALSHWFPLIEAAGLPVPKTRIVPMPKDVALAIWKLFDGKDSPDFGAEFFAAIDAAAQEVGGYPCFLRTDHTSGKHQWNRTCYLRSPGDIRAHVYAIAEFSECADFMGLPWNTWVVREFLPTIPLAMAPRYSDMPVCREFRFFVDDGVVRCWHPYWPMDSLTQGGAVALDFGHLYKADNLDALSELASAAGKAVGGSWSVDLLETRRGWFVTDMAEAHRSFHWEGCERAA